MKTEGKASVQPVYTRESCHPSLIGSSKTNKQILLLGITDLHKGCGTQPPIHLQVISYFAQMPQITPQLRTCRVDCFHVESKCNMHYGSHPGAGKEREAVERTMRRSRSATHHNIPKRLRQAGRPPHIIEGQHLARNALRSACGST